MPALSTIRTSLHGFFHWVTSGAAAVDQFAVNRRVLLHKLSEDAAAGDELAEMPIYIDSRTAGGLVVTAVKFVPAAALTAHDTNYKTVTVSWRSAAGGAATVVATGTTKTSGGGGSGNWTAFVPVSLPVTAANATLPAGGQLTFLFSKAGTGVKLPAGTLVVEYEEL